MPGSAADCENARLLTVLNNFNPHYNLYRDVDRKKSSLVFLDQKALSFNPFLEALDSDMSLLQHPFQAGKNAGFTTPPVPSRRAFLVASRSSTVSCSLLTQSLLHARIQELSKRYTYTIRMHRFSYVRLYA